MGSRCSPNSSFVLRSTKCSCTLFCGVAHQYAKPLDKLPEIISFLKLVFDVAMKLFQLCLFVYYSFTFNVPRQHKTNHYPYQIKV